MRAGGAENLRRARKPTMADVARAAGVSRQLVSLILRGEPGAREETRQRVIKLADELGYVPDDRARKLRQPTSRMLGIIFELQQPFHDEVVEQLYLAASERDYDVSLSAISRTRDETVAISSLLMERCEALIDIASSLPRKQLDAIAARVPVVLAARRPRTDTVGSARCDDIAGLRMAVEHLAALGHRRIAHIDGADAAGSADRRSSYLRTMRRLGLGEFTDVVTGGMTESEGARAMRELLTREAPPTAIIAFNDRCATGVLDIAIRNGYQIPRTLSVMGYDDSNMSRIDYVQMTTIAQDVGEIGRAAVALALEQINGAPPREIVIKPRLVARETTGPVPIDSQ